MGSFVSVLFGVVWLLVTGFLAFAALVAGGYVVPFAILALIVPYWLIVARRRRSNGPIVKFLLVAIILVMVAATVLLRLWELGIFRPSLA